MKPGTPTRADFQNIGFLLAIALFVLWGSLVDGFQPWVWEYHVIPLGSAAFAILVVWRLKMLHGQEGSARERFALVVLLVALIISMFFYPDAVRNAQAAREMRGW